MGNVSDKKLIPGNDTSGKDLFIPEFGDTDQVFSEMETDGIAWDIVQKVSSRLIILEERNQLMTELLDSVCHELHTSLSGIKGLSGSLMQHDVELEEVTRQDFLETIEVESDRISTFIKDLLQIWHMEAGTFTLQRQHTSFSVVFGQVAALLSVLARDHQFEVNIDKREASVNVDIGNIADVIIKLVERSVLYSDPGTRIILEAVDTGNEIVVSVTDWSRGIPSKGIEKVFDRFHSMNINSSTRRRDIGLSLVVCKRIIEAHDGRIWVNSKPGRGCKFSFCLPTTEHELASDDIFDVLSHKEARE